MLKRNIILYTLAAASMTGCGKKFLQKDPQGVIIQENFYKTSQDLESAINAAYDPLGWETDRKGSVYANAFFFGDVVSDDAVKGGGGQSDQGNWDAIENFIGNPSLQEFLLPWQRFYTGIYRSNLVIESVPNSEADQATKSRITGEAKFLRAYYHFELVKHFGDVPLVTKVLTADEYNLSKTPKAQVYAQIEADLKEAANLLPEKGAITLGKATKGAALALLARAQMYQTLENPSKWNDVLANAETVINSNVYDLEAKFDDVCKIATENGKESVFEVQHAINMAGQGGDNGGTWTRGNEGTLQNTMTRGRANSGWGFNVPSLNLLDSMSNDPRKPSTILVNGDAINGEIFTINKNEYPFTGTLTKKYIEETKAMEKSINVSDGPSNLRIIRFADVLLMAAEAANEISNDTAVVNKYLNRVRLRAGLTKNTIKDKVALRQAIWHERRMELAMEGHRFFDIVRQGRAAEVMSLVPEGKNFRKGVNEVFPIPQTEIDVSKGKLTQNPGY